MVIEPNSVIWGKDRADGKRGEVAFVAESGGRATLAAKVGGKEIARGVLLPINRSLPGHKNAPAGVTHLIGAFCLMAEDGRAVADAVAPIEAEIAAKADAAGEARSAARWARIEAAGVTRAEAEAVLDRWGRDGLQLERAHRAEATVDHATLLKMELAGR